MDNKLDTRRRRFLLSSAGAAAAAGLGTAAPQALAQAKPLPRYVEWKYVDSMIVHSSNTIETKRSAFGTSVIVPTDILFVRNNVNPPADSVMSDLDGWSLSVEGVRNPRKITVGELRQLGLVSVATVLQCSGNGRGFFKHKASGAQWKVGASGCVVWSGVPVAEVVKAMGGVAGGATLITASGGERIPAGIDPKTVMVERSVPLKVMDQALLAWELNGEPLPLAPGGPLRFVVPGYYGINNVKYVSRLAFTDKETAANIQTSGYRVRPIGQKGTPAQPSMWEMNVKSWINYPSGEPGELIRSGAVQIHGVAFAGVNPVTRVEVSTDGGKSWGNARFVGPDLGRYGWRQFVFPAQLEAGNTYTLASRATDAQGTTQPMERVENERAYAHNGWRDHAVRATVV